ncbi:unnamed protein product [Didymodactylos carnosus]|uniref:Uncharacterized protein n=1 Tax=Didymodactylos carnosus TaxID=1234261 RepID=A0A813R9I8_9BILA|nr:unnamed protein product [Didymodactylos carnosus]CAF1276770.1 unnamed protein product [Didymodactylos carnosus]CAF3564028.1 unnamed protein product [Didymodactylos carnosus]CAF4081877.1 unnamed protein product [Didymodactylos carnosus]
MCCPNVNQGLITLKRNAFTLNSELKTPKHILFVNLTLPTLPTTRVTTPTNFFPFFPSRTVTPEVPLMGSNNQHAYESLIITNTVVAAFSIILMVTLTGFLIFLLLPTIRRRWRIQRELQPDVSSSNNFNTGFTGHRLNPLYDPSQFGTTIFHPTHTLLHPIWAPSPPPPATSIQTTKQTQ